MRTARCVFAIITAASMACAALAQGPEEFKRRREAFRKQMREGQVLVIKGTTERNARQDSNFFYLTGMTAPGSALILHADGKEILFGSQRRRRSSRSGGSAGLKKAGAAAGIEDVKSLRSLDDEIESIESGEKSILSTRRTRSMFSRLRRIKSPAEIERLQAAIDITCAAHREVMRSARPGMYEYQLQAIIEYVFAFNGSERTGFPSIVGSGPNACILHWSQNTRKTEPGDVVVMDIGAEKAMYTADVTRTIPVSGKFTKRQRQIYEIVLAANEAAIAMVAPGVEMRAISAKASKILREGLVKVGLIKKGDLWGLRKYYFHGLSHPLGLVVHDVGGLGTLEPGMVLTIEPGLYIREENMGFRIEDDVLVTEKGHRVLSAKAPKTVAEIEKLMAKPGIDVTRFQVIKN